MRKALLFLLALSPLYVFSQFGTCQFPRQGIVGNTYDLDFSTDDGMNLACNELDYCFDPAYDAYFGYLLAAGDFEVVVSSAMGVEPIYIALVAPGCDTLYADYCGVIGGLFPFKVTRGGTYNVIIHAMHKGPFDMRVEACSAATPTNPVAICQAVGIDPAIYPFDSIPVLKVGRITMYQVSQAGKVIGYRRYWE